MKPISLDLRARIVAAVEAGESIRAAAIRFDVSSNTVWRLLKRKRDHGTIEPKAHGGGTDPYLRPDDIETLKLLVERAPDATLEQLREMGGWGCSLTTIWRALEALDLTLKVKDVHAAERDTPENAARRRSHRRSARRYGAGRMIYLDESGVNTAMTPRRARSRRGTRAHGSAPGHWESSTVVSAIGTRGILAPMVLHGSMDGATFEGYVEDHLAPSLRPGDVVAMDNLGAHKGEAVAAAIRGAGARLVYLPPYSPDLNPIEKMWSKVKGLLRRAGARTRGTVVGAVGDALGRVTRGNIDGWFRSVGLSPTRT